MVLKGHFAHTHFESSRTTVALHIHALSTSCISQKGSHAIRENSRQIHGISCEIIESSRKVRKNLDHVMHTDVEDLGAAVALRAHSECTSWSSCEIRESSCEIHDNSDAFHTHVNPKEVISRPM